MNGSTRKLLLYLVALIVLVAFVTVVPSSIYLRNIRITEED